jgi:PKD repeat protein
MLALVISGFAFSFVLQNTLSTKNNTDTELPSPQDASTLALETAYNELGSGTHALTRDKDIEYVMQDGDSLYSVGKLYVIDPLNLQEYNEITNPYRIRVGVKIIIPSKYNLQKFSEECEKLRTMQRKAEPVAMSLPASLLPAGAHITAKTVKDGPILNAHFSVESTLPNEEYYYNWDLGDGTISHNKSIDYTYLNPGVYNVSLTLKDKYGYELKTNTVTVEISSTEGSKIIRTLYLTIDAVGDSFPLEGKVSQIEDFLGNQDKPIVFTEQRDGHYFYRALRSGYYFIVARGEDIVYKIYLFISPIPSIQNDRYDVDWYRTQYNTGPSNCGPASASMALGWAKGEYVPISTIRGFLGWQGDGGTSFPQLAGVLAWKGTKAEIVEVSGIDDLYKAIDEGKIAIILYHSGLISWTAGKPELNSVGRYYADSVGHYIVVKGYSRDKKYFVVYDPIPGDWVSNGKRYGDGISMIGRNRYYPAGEIFAALSVPRILVVSR